VNHAASAPLASRVRQASERHRELSSHTFVANGILLANGIFSARVAYFTRMPAVNGSHSELHLTHLNRWLDVGVVSDVAHNLASVWAERRLKGLHGIKVEVAHGAERRR